MIKKFLARQNITIKKALKKINDSGEKCLVIVDNKKKLLGTLSDGDLRRAILKKKNFLISINSIYKKNCKFFYENNFTFKEVEKEILKNRINLIPIVDKNKIIKTIYTVESLNKKYPKKVYKQKNTAGVIMAGGKGIRMKPFTNFLPKPLIPIKNQTAIDILVKNFSKSGFNQLFVSINYKSKIMKAYFDEKSFNIKIKFIEEKKPLGTVGCLGLINLNKYKHIVVSNCDIICNFDYSQLLNFHYKEKNDLTLVCSSKDYQIPYGVCEVDEKNKFIKLKEKPKFNFFINIGVYAINTKLLKLLEKNQRQDFDEFIKLIYKNKYKIGLYPINPNLWYDVGVWNEYKKIFN